MFWVGLDGYSSGSVEQDGSLTECYFGTLYHYTCSNCANSSAEWIAEAPSGSSGLYPLTDFHTWSPSGATVNGRVISSFSDAEITMIDSSGQIKAQPGPLNSSGNGFTVTWERSS